MLILHVRVDFEKLALKFLCEAGEISTPKNRAFPRPDGRRIAPRLVARREEEAFVQILDLSIQRARDVTTLAIAALLADEIEKLGKALFIAPLVAKDICEHLAANNPLQMIVKDGHFARQPAFEGKCAENPSEKAVERAKR